jgi:hypothetical protein
MAGVMKRGPERNAAWTRGAARRLPAYRAPMR